MPEISLPVEAHDEANLSVTRFADAEPARSIGLIWPETSPRNGDFMELGRLISRICMRKQ